ncbi:MAG TPA: alcohol dehydrogenase catalytic domain-containing protein [Candidatus Angelobacter sp.]|jgi:propanol-preferring alcohol dehydrogenase|nr:alcohol dehydrogenase catalytic domain-containing protein [Candidatus Angelobacter sp.]
MKAAMMHGVGRPLRVEEVPVPEIDADEVLVETRSCGICGTDLHILKGLGYVPPLPHILGHEPAGIVTRAGKNVRGLKEGDHVVPHLFLNCGRCYYCRVGHQQQCSQLKGIIGVLVPGGFAEYFKAPAANLFRLSDRVAFDVAGLLADAVITSVHAFRRANLSLGDTAVVIGTGGIGLILIQILYAAGIRAIGVDRSDEHLQLARKLGAEATAISGAPGTRAQIREWTDGFGVQCVFNCVGTPQSMRESADFVMRCGRIVVIGEEADSPLIDTTEIAQKELEIIGSRNGTQQDLVEGIRLVEAGVIKPPIARRFPLEDINEAFDFLRQGALGRVVVNIK